MTPDAINALPPAETIRLLQSVCGSTVWCERLLARRPFRDADDLHQSADAVFDELSDSDWIEAFSFHPKIGDLKSLKLKFAGNKQWSAGEQSGMSQADEQTIQALADGNQAYEARFGYIFIVCASGKSAAEMLSLLRARLDNDALTELAIAAREQRKISHQRIDKLLNSLT